VQADPTVTSASNPAVKAARKLARADGRRLGASFLVEGPQAVREGARHLSRLFVTDAAAARDPHIVDSVRARSAEVVFVTEVVLNSITQTVSPQGMVGVGELPEVELAAALADAPLVVVLWEVRDPGNAGAIVRTADAAGAAAVVLAGDCVNPRNGKSVRASAGSLFHLPVVTEPSWQAVADACRKHGLRVVGADAAGPVSYTELDLTIPTALVFGNEARGLDEKVAADCDAVARIPIGGRAESLNLAATVAVMAFEAARQRGETA
jgi:RNA methyltransferase, TrmH family